MTLNTLDRINRASRRPNLTSQNCPAKSSSHAQEYLIKAIYQVRAFVCLLSRKWCTSRDLIPKFLFVHWRVTGLLCRKHSLLSCMPRAGDTFKTICSWCHRLPLPRLRARKLVSTTASNDFSVDDCGLVDLFTIAV